MIFASLFFASITFFCFGAEEELRVAEKTFNGLLQQFDEGSRGKGFSDTQKCVFCLMTSKKILLDLLKKEPIITAEDLSKYTDIYDISKAPNIKSRYNVINELVVVKARILDDGTMVLFWRSGASQLKRLAYFGHKGAMHEIDCFDVALSSAGNWKATLYRDTKMRVEAIINGKRVSLDTLLQKGYKAQSGAIIFGAQQNNLPPDIYCALKNELVRYTYDVERQKLILDKSLEIVQHATIIDLSLLHSETKKLLAATIRDSKNKIGYTVFDFSQEETKVIEDPAELLKVTYDPRMGKRGMLLDAGVTVNGIKTISPHDVAMQRGLSDLRDYFAMDINVKANRVALVKAQSGGKKFYLPIVETASFIPERIHALIDEFNTLLLQNPIALDEAKQLLRNIIYVDQGIALADIPVQSAPSVPISPQVPVPDMQPVQVAQLLVPVPPIQLPASIPVPLQAAHIQPLVPPAPVRTQTLPTTSPVLNEQSSAVQEASQTSPSWGAQLYDAMSRSVSWIQSTLKSIGAGILYIFSLGGWLF